MIAAAVAIALTAILSAAAFATAEVAAASQAATHKYTVSGYMTLPFVALLLAIAVMPFVNKHFWERNYHWVSYGLGAAVVIYYVYYLSATHKVLETAFEYVSFICLIGSLFVVTGGIVIKLKNEGEPLINAAILFIGSVLANLLGTTGASMLLIRPFLRINRHRMRPYLVVFFIFTVSNIGGALTPIGDPPLFLGYLKGVPFFWVIEHVIHMWGLAVLLVLGTFLMFDSYYYSRDKVAKLEMKLASEREKDAQGAPSPARSETAAPERPEAVAGERKQKKSGRHKKHRANEEVLGYSEDESLMFKIYGFTNFIFLFLILVAVFLPAPIREIIMAACAIAAYRTTPRKNHEENGFNFDPIKEVAILFSGIFATMMPALDWLEANSAALGITTPGHFYWGSGVLSSFLDNAPTYLNFLSAAIGLKGASVAELLANQPQYIIAISLGSVFFGANTYIGNGPNFMVKSIAEQQGVETPSFFGYIFNYSLPILIPIFAIIWAIFLR